MKAKNILLTMVLIAMLGFASVQTRAELPIIQADTVFAEFEESWVYGIVWAPDGEKVILMKDAQPVEVDINTHQVVREFEAVPNGNGEEPLLFIDKTKNYLGGTFFSTDYFGKKNISGGIIWDYLTGKIVKTLPLIVLQSNGDKYYSYFNNYSKTKEYLGKFDINTFKMVDSIYLPKDIPGDGYAEWGALGIIPNTNKVLVGVNRYHEYEQGNKKYVLSELYLLDFDTKKNTKIAIPVESGQNSSVIMNITVSETGKYNIVVVTYVGISHYYFFDKDFKFLFKENTISMNTKIGGTSLEVGQFIEFVDDDHAILPCIRDGNEKKRNELIYDIGTRNFNSIIDFFGGDRVSCNTDMIAMVNQNGVVGIVDKLQVPVEEISTISKYIGYINYKNNSLIINATSSEKVDIEITDYNGNVLNTIKDVFLQAGVNTININFNLPNGVYFCILKTNTGSNSYKFMVNK